MTIVICDNAALSALADLDLLSELARFFGEVSLTESVFREATHRNAPRRLRELLAGQPSWIDVRPDPEPLLHETRSLGKGEASSITAAYDSKLPALLVLDDLAARKIARSMDLRMAGVVGLLGRFAKAGQIDFSETTIRLRRTGFWITDNIVDQVRRELGL